MAKKSAVVEELDDLELVDEDEDQAPAKKSKNKKAPAEKAKAAAKPEKSESSGMGAAWLADHINEELGTEYTAANIRVVLRKMASDGDFDRAVGTDRARYQFTGEQDPIVRQVLKRIRSGAVESDRKERLEAAAAPTKERKAKAKAEELEEAPKPKRKAKAAPVEEPPAPKAKAARRRRTDEDDN